ncbi:MAG: DUF262 domain-containing protein [Synergistaceae bacterium]|nr:DUF262 domain-containing protein [Synergistaceae bacterium]
MNLFIPDYQRPYKWTGRNIAYLLGDIENAIHDAKKNQNFSYRIGTIILHKAAENDVERYGIVDGQQRIISLVLLQLFLDKSYACRLLTTNFADKSSQANIHNNYRFINDWFALKTDEYGKVKDALNRILEVVVICVDKEAEAFQLFDSQNTRGRALDPHDLLKAYHLREMKNYPYEMQHAVTKWEAVNTKEIRELFELYLFPIRKWTSCTKSFSFSAKDIDTYKGIVENSPYSYAKRASRAMPYFQIAESFIAGNDFFEMVEHYLKLLSDIKTEIHTNSRFSVIQSVLADKANNSAGFRYVKNLFYCAVLCYFDRFRNFDEQVIKKLFSWAFMLRVDMISLGFDSINKYAIGDEGRYSNNIAMFTKIINARLHSEIANTQIGILRKPDDAANEKWSELYGTIKRLNGYSVGGDKNEWSN